MKTALALIVFAMLLAGCQPDRPLPSRSIPHRLAKDTDAVIYVRTPQGDLQETDVTLPAGWWVAAPEIIEGNK